MKRENTRRWKLSSKGRLAALIGLSLVAAQPLMAQSITPVGATSVSSKNGVPVVNIVAPNAQGLSYNQYSNYNVPTQGAVLNNATVAGTSQLAGQLGANANLRGQSANVILNEVVSNNPSLLLGKQEVFGMAANLVLANPNGITCNGCGFINTPSASLVVGKPELSNGALSSYQVGANGNSNALNVTGHVGGADVLNLIAPRVNVNGNVSANSAINVKSGRQHVRADGSLATTPLSAAEQAAPQGVTTAVLDGAILGSMYAGAIRIHNTDATATTSVQGSLNGTSLVDVNTAGNLKVTASQIKGGDVALAANNLDVQGQIQSRDSSTGNSSYNFASMVSSKTSNTSHDEAFSATQISGNQVDLSAAGSNTLNAVQIKAQNLHVSGGTVQLGSTTTNSTSGSTVEQSRFAWNNKNHTTQQTQNLYGNNWQVAQDANIKATSGAVNAQAASVSAGGDLSVSGSQAVNLSGAVAQNSSSNTVNYVAQGNALQTGRNVTASSQQNFTGTSLQAGGNVAIGSSGGNVALQGTQVSGQQVALTSQGTTSIGSQTSQNTSTNSVDFLNAGGIAGGENHHNSTTSITQHGSSIQGQHVAVNGNGGVSVTASAINGTNGVQLASSDGDVKLGYAFNNTSGTSGNRHGAAFNITDASDATTTSADTTVGSSVTSQSAITLSGNNVGAAGSAVSAGQALNLNAANAVTTDIADAQTGSTKQNYTLGFAGYASQNGSALQYTAGLNLQGVTTTTGQSSGLATANSLSGSTVNIQGGNAVALKGSQIAASSGPVTITAPNVTVAAGDSKSSSSDNNTQLSNGGPFISAGLNGLFIGVQAGGAKTENHTETHDAVVSTIQAPGNVSLQAGQTLQNKGTIITT
ncbi:MAG: filamentous hemagglutinin N-terminal domain-containing protein, partial [Brachymonas sp.]|nr:filamentous hemagglutinin N-terminal domain-containing protein [Brachymonas sp.]